MNRYNPNRRDRDYRDSNRETYHRYYRDYNNDMNEDQAYAPYRNEHDTDRRDWNRDSNYYHNNWYRDNEWYRANDYNNRPDNQPPYSQRNEEWYRHTYGLPANGSTLRDQRRHDIGQWNNSNFSQGTSNKEYNRINSRFDRDENRREENSRSEGEYYDNLNRYYTGDQRGTWNRRADDNYNWGDNSEYGRYGEHRGKGPKGYSRGDDRIKDDINDRLTDDAHIDASDIEVSVLKGEVTLTGSVVDRHAKRRAEDIAELVSGVTNVENRLRVRSDKTSPEKSSTPVGTNGHYSDKKKATAL